MNEFIFIVVNKVIKEKDGRLSSKAERIKIKDIKSYRSWFKNESEKIAFKEDMIILYMREKEDQDKSEVKAVKILESLKKFDERMGVIQLHNEVKS